MEKNKDKDKDKDNIRRSLRECEPYFIEFELIPQIYFNDNDNEEKTNYWVFFYYFVRKLSYLAIGVRLGYEDNTIHYKLKNILKANKTIIQHFIAQHST